MTKDEALDRALNALLWANIEINDWRDDAHGYKPEDQPQIMEAITAIKQARSAPVQEPVGWMNPHGTFLSASYIDNFASGLDKEIHNIPVYTTPPARPAPVQEPDAVVTGYHRGQCVITPTDPARVFNTGTAFYTTPLTAAQRQWVGLTDDEIQAIAFTAVSENWDWLRFARAIEAKLKEKNNG
jgi:hypothetical protein